MRAYEITAGSNSLDGLRRCQRPDPEPQPTQILVRIHAASLNYRDLLIARGHYMGGTVKANTVPLSDGAGEVIAVGAGVTRFRVGERVAGTFFRGWFDGRPPAGPMVALGAPPADGVLAELVAFDQQNAVTVPAHLSYAGAATLPCAAVTAWRSLVDIGRITPGETVLVLGTGGVSIFGLQLARLAGARVLVTSSSDEKLARLKAMGADEVIDYTKTDWSRWAVEKYGKPQRRSYDGGVDVVINFTGGDTWVPSLRCLKRGGKLLVCGATAGYDPKEDLRYVWSFEIKIIGSNSFYDDNLSALMDLISEGKIKPVIDKVLPLEQAREGLRLIESREVIGKVIVTP